MTPSTTSMPGERIVVHAHEFADLAGVVDTRQRRRKRDRMRIEEPRADMRAEPEAHMARLADARGGDRVAQSAELRQLEAHRIDDAVRHQRHDFVDGASALVGLDHDRHRARHEFQTLEVVARHRLLDEIESRIRPCD